MRPDERLSRLRRHLEDWSYPDRRSDDLLEQIDRDLAWAFRDHIRVGTSADDVERLLGSPHLLIGDKEDNEMEWYYPCLPADGTPLGGWYFRLEFRSHAVISVAKTRRRSAR